MPPIRIDACLSSDREAVKLLFDENLSPNLVNFLPVTSQDPFNAAFIAEFGNNESDSLLVLH